MRYAQAVLALAVLLVACDESAEDLVPSGDQAFTVDCLGMVPSQISGAPEGTTRLPVAGDLSTIQDAQNPFAGKLANGNRCWFRFTGPFGEDATPVIGFDTVNSALLAINLGGQAFLMAGGDISLDPGSRRGKVSGSYRGTFKPVSGDLASPPIELKGRFDYCHTPTQSDCPYVVEGLLDYPLTVSAAKFGQDVHAEAIECRALINRQTGAMQLDLQIGVWRGQNLGNLFDNCAEALDRVDYDLINHNQLRFRAGGVTGPGTYGPFLSQFWRGGEGEVVELPSLNWKAPPAFAFLYTEPAATLSVCTFLLTSGCHGFPCEAGSYVRTVPDRSTCTITITEPDQIGLRCEGVEAHVPNQPPFFEQSDFALDTRCRITYLDP